MSYVGTFIKIMLLIRFCIDQKSKKLENQDASVIKTTKAKVKVNI